MLACEETRELMSLYIDDQLSNKELEAFNEHISHCKQCAQEVNILKTIVRECNNIEEVELPSDFKQQLHQKLVQTQKDMNKKNIPWYMNWKMYSGLAAGLILAFLINAQLSNPLFSSMTKSEKAYVAEANLESYDSVADTVEKSTSQKARKQSLANDERKLETKEHNIAPFSFADKSSAGEMENEDNGSQEAFVGVAKADGNEMKVEQEQIMSDVFAEKEELFVYQFQIMVDSTNVDTLLQKIEKTSFEYTVDYQQIGKDLIIGIFEEDGVQQKSVDDMIGFIKSVTTNSEINGGKEDITKSYRTLLSQYKQLEEKISQLQASEKKIPDDLSSQIQELRHKIYEMQHSMRKCIITIKFADGER